MSKTPVTIPCYEKDPTAAPGYKISRTLRNAVLRPTTEPSHAPLRNRRTGKGRAGNRKYRCRWNARHSRKSATRSVPPVPLFPVSAALTQTSAAAPTPKAAQFLYQGRWRTGTGHEGTGKNMRCDARPPIQSPDRCLRRAAESSWELRSRPHSVNICGTSSPARPTCSVSAFATDW
jgi:hypothetical protein